MEKPTSFLDTDRWTLSRVRKAHVAPPVSTAERDTPLAGAVLRTWITSWYRERCLARGLVWPRSHLATDSV